MKNSRILYIGNDLTKKSKYNSTMHTLSVLLEGQGYTIRRSSNKKNKLLRVIDMCFSVLRNAKKTDYVLIDTFSTLNFYFAVIVSQLSRLFSIHYIPILHGGNLPNRLQKSKYLSQLIFGNSYKNVAPSLYLKTHFDAEGYQTLYIPNTLEISEYSFKEREKLTPKILWVRAFDKTYNPTLAIEVINILKIKYPDVELCMVGPEKDHSLSLCRKLVHSYGLSASVSFTGILKKEEWHELSKNYDIFINTTNIDNTPVSVIEVMALGLAVVSTNVGGIPYLIKNGYDGVLVERDNAQEMSEAIDRLILENDTEMRVRAREKVTSFDWSVVKEKWNSILV